jgi:serine/threonine-protein kinase
MPLSAGTRLGPYEIQAAIGAGGMGEVYRAHDTRLGRDVAIKVLPRDVSADPDRRARFEREAKTIAGLNHPHICTLHDVGEHNGSTYLVMEHLQGQTLADRVAKGPLPLEQALTVATEIADALTAAHRQGVIHRDLKPGNVVLTKTGAKLLDFGLAKLKGHGEQAAAASLASAPTQTRPLTSEGAIVGTLQYMAPEQVEGKPADARTDLWALGAILYEMLTGKRAFEGASAASLIGHIMNTEPPALATLQPLTPPALDRLVRQCLAKAPDERPDTAHDLTSQLRSIRETSGAPGVAGTQAQREVRRRREPRVAVFAAGGLLLFATGAAIAAALLVWAPWRTTPVPALLTLSADIGADALLDFDQGSAAILSPDGQTLAFVATVSGLSKIFVRRLDQLQAAPLAGTDGAASPFFSPDGQQLGFFANGKLKKVPVTGGAASVLSDAPNGRGATWADDDTIIFTPATAVGTRLMRVSAAGGGAAEPFSTLSPGAKTQRWPQAIARRVVLYTEHSDLTGFDSANLVVVLMAGGVPKTVVKGGYYGRYLPTGLASPKRGERKDGHLIYVQQSTLFAVRFDLDRLEIVGRAVPVLDDLAANPRSAGAQVAFSPTGTLVYQRGAITSRDESNPIDWMTRDGNTSSLRAAAANWANPRFSPDGLKLALEISDGKQSDIYTYDWTRDRLTQLTFDPNQDRWPVWTPDSRGIAFASDRAKPGIANIYYVNADGTGSVTRLTDSPGTQTPSSWHGKILAFSEKFSEDKAAPWDLMMLPVEGDGTHGWTPGKPTVLPGTSAAKGFLPVFSPDGRFFAYSATEGGDRCVYVRPFPGPVGQWRISTDSGAYPRWSGTSELLFISRGKVWAARYSVVGDSFQAETPQEWSPTKFMYVAGTGNASYDVHPDGKRVALLAAKADIVNNKIVFAFNFFEQLRRLLPESKR